MYSIKPLFSPLSYLGLMWLAYVFSFVDNGFGWGSAFPYYPEDHIFVYVVFTIAFLLGCVTGASLASGRTIVHLNLNPRKVWVFLVIASLFQIGKFINIGDIPLLGDPMSRYRTTLGGYEDYPSRLLAPLSILFFYLYMTTKNRTFLYGSLFAFSLPLLLMQRQEIMNSMIGGLMTYALFNRFSVRTIVTTICLSLIFLVIVVAGLAMVRFGYENLAGNMGVFEAVFWVFHGELTTPIRLGAFIHENIESMNGRYTLAGFASVFIPGFSDHGAEFIRRRFTDADTAQSVGGLYGYMLDFGIIGVGVFSFLSASFVYYFYTKWIKAENIVYVVMYPIIFSQLLWNIRSGNFVIMPMLLYMIFAIFYITEFSNRTRLANVFGLGFLMTIPLSFVGLVVRI